MSANPQGKGLVPIPEDWLDQEGALEDHLPFHVRSLPYYRRLLAAGMSSSLKSSTARSGPGGRRSREWLAAESMPALPS